MQLRLANKVALITGVGSGIGQCCARMFAEQGAQVLGCELKPDLAQQSLVEAQQLGLNMDIELCDLTDPAQVTALVATTIQRYGRLDIVVNAAAFAYFAPIEQLRYSDWKSTLIGELDIVFLLCQRAWPYLKQSGAGSIINFASANAWMALEGSPALAHCAGKGGILAMTRQLAMEGGPFGIRANSISPGLIETAATRLHMQQDPTFKATALSKQILRQRIGQPSDVAWAAIYLASDEAKWVTGVDLKVDAGATAC
jgi:NAD(P)-dependent dehydrogenase (short-subunit alcohol dehydrogenase family)